MSIKKRKLIDKSIDDLLPYINNSRTHSKDQIKQVAASISEFGFTNPVLIDESNMIIAGHGRVQAAQLLGLSKVPCIVLDGLTEAQKKAYVIADNKLALNAGWDDEMLANELMHLQEQEYDISLLGFDDSELSELLKQDDVNIGLTDEDDCPETPEQPVTVEGDIWLLGKHRLMCGDSTDAASVAILMDGQKANMLFTDPPYLMDFTGGIHGDGSKSFNAKHGKIKNDKMSDADGNEFLDKINNNIKEFVDGAFYITFYRLGIDKYYASLNRVKLQPRSLIIWDKGNHTLSNSDYKSMYEPMFYGWVNKHKFYGGKNGMDIWRIPRTKKNDLHPTMKPVELVEKALLDGCQVNGVVLDLFGGSGTALIACEKNNRVSRIMELDPTYCDVIIKRWQDYTGNKATLEADERTFEEVENERSP